MNYFQNIIGQDLAIEILNSAISKNKIAPAYLFTGPEGVGRKKVAKIFIKSIIEKGISKGNTKKKIESNNYPDLIWIKPMYLFQGKIISQEQAKIESINIKAPPQIRLNQIKQIIEFLGRKPLEAEKSMIIIEDIERMNESASNALLKTLEEPNEGMFILISQRPEKLLSTIRSRCQRIPFNRLDDNQLSQIIEKMNNFNEINEIQNTTKQELVTFSNGSPGLYLTNLRSWLEIPKSIRDQMQIKLTNPIEALSLAREITEELNVEQQLWLINLQQNNVWNKEKNETMIKKLEDLRRKILSYVQPRLSWEITLLEINFNY